MVMRTILRLLASAVALWIALGVGSVQAGGPSPYPSSTSPTHAATAPRWVGVASPRTLPGLSTPAGLAIDARGIGSTSWMYVSDTASGRIYKLGTRGRYL